MVKEPFHAHARASTFWHCVRSHYLLTECCHKRNQKKYPSQQQRLFHGKSSGPANRWHTQKKNSITETRFESTTPETPNAQPRKQVSQTGVPRRALSAAVTLHCNIPHHYTAMLCINILGPWMYAADNVPDRSRPDQQRPRSLSAGSSVGTAKGVLLEPKQTESPSASMKCTHVTPAPPSATTHPRAITVPVGRCGSGGNRWRGFGETTMEGQISASGSQHQKRQWPS